MASVNPVENVAALLREAGNAHHRAFAATNGEDPDWPRWYAAYLLPKLANLLPAPLTVAELAARLQQLEDERARLDPRADWPAFYAARILAGRTTSA